MASSGSAEDKNVEIETVTIGNARYEVPKEVVEQFYAFFRSKPSSPKEISAGKSSTPSDVKDIVVYDSKAEHFVEYCAGVGSVGEKELLCMPEWVRNVKSAETMLDVQFADNIIEDVMSEPKSGNSVDIIGEELLVENPEGVKESDVDRKDVEGGASSDSTEILFGYTMDEISTPMRTVKRSTGIEEALDKLDGMSDIGKHLKDNVSKTSEECETVQDSSTGYKKKRAKAFPKRKQPIRESKRKLEITEEEKETPKSSAKRLKKEKTVGKEILMEVDCSEKFLIEEGLQEVLESLRIQGWDKLCETQEFVCPKAVQDFYSNLHLISGEIPALELKFRGKKLRVSSMDLAVILRLDHCGYDHFVKGGSWPEDAEDKKTLIKRICKLDKIPKGPISTIHMDPTVKILHKLLVCNFIQRGAKPSYVQDEDLLLLDKLLKGEKINLPKLIIHQMYHIKNLSQIGYSRVIKRILQMHKLYEVKSESDIPVVRDFDPDLFRKMKLMKDPELGWIRTSVSDKPEGADDEEEPVYSQELVGSSNIAYRLSRVEKGLAELKVGMEDIKDKVKDIKSGIKDLLAMAQFE